MPAHQKALRTPAKNKQNAPPSLAAKPGPAEPRSSSPVKGGAPPAVAPPSTPAPLQEYKQIQDDEVEALKSIFMDDYQHVQKSGAWNVSQDWRELEIF